MKIRSLLVTIGFVVAIGIVVLQRLQISRLTAELEAAQRQSEQSVGPETGSSTTGQVSTAAGAEQSTELLRLRAEVTALRRQTNEIAKLQAQNAVLQHSIETMKASSRADASNEAPMTEERRFAMARLKDSKVYALALIMHAEDNQGHVTTNFNQLAPYLSKSGDGGMTGTNQFEIMFQGPRQGVPNASQIILIRDHRSYQLPDGRWSKTYAFLDGHSEVHTEPTSNFEQYEQQHTWPPPQ